MTKEKPADEIAPESNESNESRTRPGLTSKQMTWAWILSEWVAFAKSATGLPDEGWGKQAKESVAHIIQLQALWHALGACQELPDQEVKLAIDKARLLFDKHVKRLFEIWGERGEMPDSIAELMQGTLLKWALVSADFHSEKVGQTRAETPGINIDFQFPKPVIGLAGGIASGKSFIAKCFSRYACQIIDSDQIARSLLTERSVIEAIRNVFSEDVINEAGEISRARLGEIVFADSQALEKLEGILHPQVRKQRLLERELAFQDPTVVAIVEDCPLLFEKQIDQDCDVTIFIDVPHQIREKRVVEGRGWTPEELTRREKAQLGLDIKARRADYVIKNDVSPEMSNAQSAGILSEILCNFPHENLD